MPADRTKEASRGRASSGRFRGGRKPHNVKPAEHISGLQDLVIKVGSETRSVMLQGEAVEMSRAERALRLTVERALEGKVGAVADMLRLMMKYPQFSKSYKEETVLIIAGTDLNA